MKQCMNVITASLVALLLSGCADLADHRVPPEAQNSCQPSNVLPGQRENIIGIASEINRGLTNPESDGKISIILWPLTTNPDYQYPDVEKQLDIVGHQIAGCLNFDKFEVISPDIIEDRITVHESFKSNKRRESIAEEIFSRSSAWDAIVFRTAEFVSNSNQIHVTYRVVVPDNNISEFTLGTSLTLLIPFELIGPDSSDMNLYDFKVKSRELHWAPYEGPKYVTRTLEENFSITINSYVVHRGTGMWKDNWVRVTASNGDTGYIKVGRKEKPLPFDCAGLLSVGSNFPDSDYYRFEALDREIDHYCAAHPMDKDSVQNCLIQNAHNQFPDSDYYKNRFLKLCR